VKFGDEFSTSSRLPELFFYTSDVIPQTRDATCRPARIHAQSNPGGPVEPFFVRVNDAGEYALVFVGGELDIATAPLLRDRLADLTARGHTRLVLDLDELAFADAMGLSVLVAAYANMQRRGGWLRLVHVHPRVVRVLSLLRLAELLPAYASVHDALAPPRRAGEPR
jgi:anti-sigma B factor antagonist